MGYLSGGVRRCLMAFRIIGRKGVMPIEGNKTLEHLMCSAGGSPSR